MNRIDNTIQAYFAAIRAGDADAWASCFAEDGVAYDPADAPPRVGRAAHREFFAGVAALFEELDFRPGTVFVCGPEAAVRFTARCRARNGRTVELEGIDLFEVDGAGRVKRVRGFWDPAPLFAAATD